MLTKKHLQDVCLLHCDHKQCRYIKSDPSDYSKHYCIKHSQGEKSIRDKEVEKIFQESAKNGCDPASFGAPLADNCTGYPLLRHIEQGYDKP